MYGRNIALLYYVVSYSDCNGLPSASNARSNFSKEEPGKLIEKATTQLSLSNVDWPSYDVPHLKWIYLSDVMTTGKWKSCSRLEKIYIRREKLKVYKNFTSIPTDWLNNCTGLVSLRLRNFSLAEIRAIVDSAPSVKELDLDEITDISCIPHYSLFPSLRNNERMTKVFLNSYSHNNKTCNTTWAEVSVELTRQLSFLSHLERLIIDDRSFDMCASGMYPPVNFASLQYLSLAYTNTTRLCFKEYRTAPRLAELNLSYIRGLRLQFSELFSAPMPHLAVDFNYQGQVVSFEFTREDYLALSFLENKDSQKGHVELLKFRHAIDCDCHSNWWFSRALRAGLVTADDVSCTNDSVPEELACEWIDCERIACNTTCVCCREEPDAITVDCRGANLTTLTNELLHLPNMRQLIAPNNNISTLPHYLPDSLHWVDLSGNNIWQNAGIDSIKLLFTQPARRMRLSRNNILCSCDTKNLITLLQNHRHQIEDFQSITCAVTNMKLGNVDVTSLCAARDQVAELLKHRETVLLTVGLVLAVAVVSFVVSLMLYYRRREVKIFLFARGLCLCCLKEEELDADRQYDVFISFCHEDSTLVLEELLPPLDRDYSVCLHLRDWCPGEKIPTQITMSVEQSRRTIVVMSRHFIRSLWGCLEFQTAHVSGLVEGRVRVVMVILDDVLESNELSSEFRSYVRLNTYVRWGDPWFWEKLRYALPHKPTYKAPLVSQQNENCNNEQYIHMEELN